MSFHANVRLDNRPTKNQTAKNEGRAELLGFAVLQCSSKSCFQANLTIKVAYYWARVVEITCLQSSSLDRKNIVKNSIFHHVNI